MGHPVYGLTLHCGATYRTGCFSASSELDPDHFGATPVRRRAPSMRTEFRLVEHRFDVVMIHADKFTSGVPEHVPEVEANLKANGPLNA